MKRFHHMILMLICLACVSCEVEFDFNDLKSDPILCIDMNLAYDPTQNISITYPDRSSFLSGSFYAVPSITGEIEFSEDDKHIMEVNYNNQAIWKRFGKGEMEYFDNTIDTYLPNPSPGDEVMVTLNACGFTSRASVTFPQKPPHPTVSHSRINDKKFRISFTIEDDPSTEDAYAFSFHRCFAEDGDPDYHVSGSEMEIAFGIDTQTSILGTGPFDIIWKDQTKMYGVFDKSFNGQQKTFEVNVDYDLSLEDGGGKYAYYRIKVHRYTPSRLKYEIACLDKENNFLGSMGLAPITFAYTNVIGGTGCVSCSYVGATDWILIPSLD